MSAASPFYVCLAEYGTMHPDGTGTAVRGWITHWAFDGLPRPVNLYALLDIPPLETTHADIDVSVLRPGQKQAEKILEGQVVRTETEFADLNFFATVPVRFEALQYGDHEVIVRVGEKTASARLRVRQEKKP